MSVPVSYVTLREEEGYKPAVRMSGYKRNTSRPLAAILSLNTIANTIGAAGVGSQATIVFGSEFFGVVSAITTVLILVFAEIIPKTIGTTHCKALLGFTAGAIRVMIFILFPIVVTVEIIQTLIRLASSREQRKDTAMVVRRKNMSSATYLTINICAQI